MKSKIAIFQTDLRLGGIQKSLINLLNNIDVSLYEIDLYLFSHDNFYSAEFPREVNILYMRKQSSLARFMPFWVYYLFKRVRIKKQYDLAIDFNGYQSITAAYSLKTPAKKKVYWVHSDLYVRRNTRHKNIIKFIYVRLLLSRNKWRRFDKFVGVSGGVLEGFRADFPNKETTVVSNIIDTDEIIAKSREKIYDLEINDDLLNLVVLGRLEYAKGVDLLIPRMAEVIGRRQDVRLYIIGDGSGRRFLEEQVRRLGLDGCITLLGAKENPYKYLKVMDGLILYSRYEGQGMVLMEAKALGLPYYFPKHLEKYNIDLVGVDDIVDALEKARKPSMLKPQSLEHYNKDILKSVSLLFSGE